MQKLELLIQEHEEQVGFGRVKNIHEAYYILSDGSFLGCNYDMGTRGDDHRAIFSSCDIERDDWEKLHSEYQLIRYIPESNMGLIKTNQKLTPQQIQIIDTYNLDIEEY